MGETMKGARYAQLHSCQSLAYLAPACVQMTLEGVLQTKLNTPSRSDRIDRPSEPRRFQKAHRYSEVIAVYKVEDVHTESKILPFRYRELLHDCEVKRKHIAGAKSVAANAAVCTGRGHQR